jgi:uncharacterized protein YggE
MSNQPVVSVKGEATLEVEPEIALLSVTVQARDKDRHRVLELLTSRSQHMLSRVKAYGEAVEKLESQPASVRPEFKDVKARERISGYLATAGLTVTVSDFTVLGELVTGLAAEELVSVSGPWWNLRPDSPVHRQARLAAATDAMQRAREYAEAFGGRITGLVEAADAGLLGTQPERGAHMFRAMSAVASSSAQPDELSFEPAKQTVRAQVEARFTMTPPEFEK